jgi:hypothetical protein
MLSINPDAHSIPELDHMRWGVAMARKGGVPADRVTRCLFWKSRAISARSGARSPGRPDAADAVAVDLGRRFSKPPRDWIVLLEGQGRRTRRAICQAPLSGPPAAAGLMPQALTWHWRVPMPRAMAAAAASQGPRAQGQTNVYEQGTHQAELRHCSEREQDNPCDRRSRNRDNACRAFASAHRARPSLEWKQPRYWRISRRP